MNALRKFLVIVRPVQCLTAAAAVIAVARIAAGHFVFDTPIIMASIAMALLVFGSSVFHCAFQNHNHPLTRRVNDYIRVQHPYAWGTMAFLAFQGSIYLTARYLPIDCTIATVLAGGLVILYTARRGFNTLNWLIGLVCSVPVFVGWGASHIPVSWVTFALAGLAWWIYFIRETTKDFQEHRDIALRSSLCHGVGSDGEYHEHLGGAIIISGVYIFGGFILTRTNGLPVWMAFLLFPYMTLLTMLAALSNKRRYYPQGAITALLWMFMAGITFLG